SGIDGDFDKAVELAHGEYCWPMSVDEKIVIGHRPAIFSVSKFDRLVEIAVDSGVRGLGTIADLREAEPLGFNDLGRVVGGRSVNDHDLGRPGQLFADVLERLADELGPVSRRNANRQARRGHGQGSKMLDDIQAGDSP
ncbi:MAG TPA: hypothetical protein VK678_21415, partial [Bradyrhizobium sp.]|nr:hypothetical protein [Bradyrhizobium sp.]